MRDTETLEAEAIKAETDAQKAYETYVKDTNKSIEEKTRDITNKTEEKATAVGDDGPAYGVATDSLAREDAWELAKEQNLRAILAERRVREKGEAEKRTKEYRARVA